MLWGDPSKAREKFGWKPKVTFKVSKWWIKNVFSHKIIELCYQITVLRFAKNNTTLLLFLLLLECHLNSLLKLLFIMSYIGYCWISSENNLMVWQNIKHYIYVLHLFFSFCIWNLFLLEMGFLSASRWKVDSVDSHLLEYGILSVGK